MPDVAATSMPIISRAEAKALGLKRYFTGKPCKRGHVAERYVSAPNCTACAGEWKKSNPEKAAASVRCWGARNQDKVRASKVAYSERNKESERKRLREYAIANRQIMRDRRKRWRSQNPHYFAEYAAANPEIIRAAALRRRAKERGCTGSHTAADIADILRLQKKRCAVPTCRTSLANGYHVDHIQPLSRGGSNDRRNLQALCPTCNLSKGASDPIDFMQRMGALL